MNQKLRGPFLFLLICCFFALPASAQDYYSATYQYKPISLGITFSPNVGWLRYGDADEYDSSPKLGYAYGLLADFAFTENYYFSTGLLINTLNSKAEYPDPVSSALGSRTTTDYRLQYVEFPIALKLKSTMRYFRSYYGQFGFTAGIKLNAKEQTARASSRTKVDGADLLRLGLQIGGGVEWQLDHNLSMMTGLTFNNGFTQVIGQGEPRNSYISFNFGIFF